VARDARWGGRPFQRNQRAPAVADQSGFGDARGIQQGHDEQRRPLSQRLRCLRQPLRQWHGQVCGQRVCCAWWARSRLANPDAVVAEHAVDEDHRGLGRLGRVCRRCHGQGIASTTVVCMASCRAAPEASAHGQRMREVLTWGYISSTCLAALSARLRSSIKSSGSADPMDRRMAPCVIAPPAVAPRRPCGGLGWGWPGG